MSDPDYISLNRESWNKRTNYHLNSAFYDMPGFKAGNTSLKSIELNLLGDIAGKSILHLQCHFGQDSMSMARMGANVTGVDLSDNAIENAQKISAELQLNTQFICCDLYNLPAHLDAQFDIVITSYGTIGWLPDLDKWAAIIQRYLKPGGQFVFVEFHPVVWMFNDAFTEVGYSYFNTGPIYETELGTYADKNAPIKSSYVAWNHGMAEVIGSLIQQGMEIKQLQEYDYSPYNCFQNTEEFAPGKFRIKHLENRIPMVYALQAVKRMEEQ